MDKNIKTTIMGLRFGIYRLQCFGAFGWIGVYRFQVKGYRVQGSF